ncbi:hypothetical protein RJ55_02489 [Drechmeria coniospora]|nr:hypothetical protein RJ55_02489 [Drechmeria coniospora]
MGGPASTSIDLPSVESHRLEDDPDRRARCLKHLLKANHVSHSIADSSVGCFHNQIVHLLCTAYLLGATDVQMQDMYETEIKCLKPWTPSPAEVINEDWIDLLGDKQYQRAYVDFFEDSFALDFAYDWKRVLRHFLFRDDGSGDPLLHGLICGFGHTLIHLAYAYEMDSKEIAMEALGLICVEYNFLHKYTSESSYTRPSPRASKSPIDLLSSISTDERFQRPSRKFQYTNLESLFDDQEDVILEYWNGWELDDPTTQFRLCQEAAVTLLSMAATPGSRKYNFYLVHLLAASHALRVLLPIVPTRHRVTLLRQWWLLAIAVYVIEGRPQLRLESTSADAGSKDWAYVATHALSSGSSKDAHFLKAIRAMHEAAKTWGDDDGKYLKAAVTFVDHFDGWTI